MIDFDASGRQRFEGHPASSCFTGYGANGEDGRAKGDPSIAMLRTVVVSPSPRKAVWACCVQRLGGSGTAR